MYCKQIVYHEQGCSIESNNFAKTISFSIVKSLKGHKHVVNTVKGTGMDGIIGMASPGHTVRIWRITNGECLHTIQEHRDKILDFVMLNEKTMLTVGLDHRSTILNFEHGIVIRSLRFISIFHCFEVTDSKIA